jgi:DNA (cytosine-5)-methyltransferase 1
MDIVERTPRKTLRAISLYTGAGGLDFGFEAAGFETVVAVEVDPKACAVIRLNRPKWRVIEDDIQSVSSERILSEARLKPGEADVLIGGPPCQPFSKSGYWKTGDARRLDDPRANTLTAYLRVLRDTKPRAFLLENVHGLAFSKKDEGLQFLLNGIDEVNKEAGTAYQVDWQLINAANYGVPQFRERVFLVGSHDGQRFTFPQPTHGEPTRMDMFGTSLEPYRTAWDALGDLPESHADDDLRAGGVWADLLPSIPEGHNYLYHTPRGRGKSIFGWRTRYWSFLLKLSKSRPSWTIQAQPGPAIGPFHWKNRRLSIREMCRLQTFPEDIEFDVSRNEAQRLLGNAVPSLVGEILARAIREQLLQSRMRRLPLKLLPPRRGVAPKPERRRRVPKKYLPLVGDHADHPGTGKGIGAQRRAVGQPASA